MRTKNLFRTLAAASLAVISMSAFGQTAAGPANASRSTNSNALAAGSPEGVDVVTVGSSMPYNVTSDQEVAKMVRTNPTVFSPSEFRWRVDGDPAAGTVSVTAAAKDTVTRTVRADDGTSILTDGTTTNYYEDTAIVVNWITAGVYDINVLEQTRNLVGLPTCPGADSSLRVFVMPRPKVGFDRVATTNQGTTNDSILGGCSMAGVTVTFALDVVGVDRYRVYYTRAFTPLGASSASFTKSDSTAIIDGANTFLSLVSSTPNTDNIDAAFTYTVPADNTDPNEKMYGKWSITITAVSDRITRKSFVSYTNQKSATFLAYTNMVLYSLPSPTTGTIKHVANNTAW